MRLGLEINTNRLIFLVSCFVFLFVGWFFSVFMVFGAFCGFVACLFAYPVYLDWNNKRKRDKLVKYRNEVAKLEKEIGV